MICKSLSILGFAIHTLTNLTLFTVWNMKRLDLDKGPEQWLSLLLLINSRARHIYLLRWREIWLCSRKVKNEEEIQEVNNIWVSRKCIMTSQKPVSTYKMCLMNKWLQLLQCMQNISQDNLEGREKENEGMCHQFKPWGRMGGYLQWGVALAFSLSNLLYVNKQWLPILFCGHDKCEVTWTALT